MANIHILGAEGSGKTVFISVLAQRFRQVRDGYPCLVFNDAETNFYVSEAWKTLTQDCMWPAPTKQCERLSWTLCTADGREHNLTFWDTHGAQGLGILREALRADMVIFLVDLLEIVGLNGGARANLESSIVLTLKTLLANGKPLAVLLSKYDLLKKYIEQHREDITLHFADEKEPEMAALEVLRRWLPEAYANLKNVPKRTYVGFVSSVADTEKRVGVDVHNNNIGNPQIELNESTEEGEKIFPRENFSSYGLDEVMSWVTTSLPVIAQKRRSITILAAAVAAIALVSVFTLKNCSSDSASANDAAVLADGEDANTPAYEIEITTNNSQKVTIYEQYKDWDKNNGKPIAGAVILDEFIPAGRAKKITGRGKLYIREEVLKGSKIKYPSKESFDNAGNAALIPLGAKPRQMSGTTSTAWLIDPDL